MRISFDAQPLVDGEKTGVGYCEAGILTALKELYPENEYLLEYFSFKNPEEKLANLRPFTSENCRAIPCGWFPGSLYRLLWNFMPIPYSFFFSKKSEITHFFNFHVPPGVHGKKVSTVHDMAFMAFPDTVRLKTKLMLNLSLARSCRRADMVMTVSEFSRDEIVKYLGVPREKIFVIYNGVDLDTFRPLTDSTVLEEIRAKYCIPGAYFLYLGTLEPRKNIERLLEAYSALKKENHSAPDLVIAGRKGWLYDSIFERVKTLEIGDSVIFTGYVDNMDKPALYSGAQAFLFPSLYEGFGMPPLEAMACGTPVLTSNCSSLPEVVGDAAVLVDPYSVGEIKDGMKRLMENESLRGELSQKGLERVKLFTWERAAGSLMDIYKELTERE